ncbi:MAG: DNA-protecting protein DprA [Firmicutes bacterium]|nr:DNA-protecting protein DprA [[Eubacterium] siraeum]MCM1487850.1 DNA-protecting protein DprA [Bacillota bacterium]
MEEYYLWLQTAMGAANPKASRFIERYGSPKEAYRIFKEEKDRRFLSLKERERCEETDLDECRRILDKCQRDGISIMTIGDGDYPYRLQNIYSPPILLFYKGNLKGLNNEFCISGVGSRNPTMYTARITDAICTDIAGIGAVLVSGMAEGVDHLVHNAAINAGGKTIGVLACGLNVEYPKESLKTRERIYELGGACISELLPDAGVVRNYFHERNRIIAGLSVGTMVFQASEHSGSLITAEHTVNLGRDLYCVPPHNLFSPEYYGVVKYLREGAIPLFDAFDVINNSRSELTESIQCKYQLTPEYHFSIVNENEPEDFYDNGSPAKITALKRTVSKPKKEKAVSRTGEAAAAKYDFDSREPEYRRIYRFLSENGKQQLENITAGCNISPDDISLYLLELEMDGIVECCPGANYKIKE